MLRIITITTITTTLRHPLKEFSFRAGKEWGGGCLPVLPAQHAFSGARTGKEEPAFDEMPSSPIPDLPSSRPLTVALGWSSP